MKLTYEADSIIDGLIRNNPANTAARQFWKDLKEQLHILVPEDFMIRYESERLPHLIRYIRSIGIRAQRAWLDFDKDLVKAREIQLFADRLHGPSGGAFSACNG